MIHSSLTDPSIESKYELIIWSDNLIHNTHKKFTSMIKSLTNVVLEDEPTENEAKWHAIAAQKDLKSQFHLLKPLNPLSEKVSDKNQICAICSNAATLQCISCHQNWCSHEHYLLDDEPIHSFICGKLTELWYLKYFNKETGAKQMSDEIRIKAETMIQTEILRVCEQRARMFVCERQYILGLAPSIRANGISKELFGTHSHQYVESNMLLTKIHLGMRKFGYVNKSVSQLTAETADLINQQLRDLGRDDLIREAFLHYERKSVQDNLVRFPIVYIPFNIVYKFNPKLIQMQSKIQLLVGQFYQMIGEKALSLQFISDSIYFESLITGPTSLEVTNCYLELGKTHIIGQKPVDMQNFKLLERFQRQNSEIQKAIFILNTVVDIWNSEIRRSMNAKTTLSIDSANIGEPRLLLQDCKAIFSMYMGQDSYWFIKTSSTLALFYVMYDQDYEAVMEAQLCNKAINKFNDICELNNKWRFEVQQFEKDMNDLTYVLDNLDLQNRIKSIKAEELK